MTVHLQWFPLVLLVGCGGLPESKTTDTGEWLSSVDVLGIIITPDEVIVPVGSDVQLEAIALNEERESFDLTDAVEWTSGSGTVASVSNEFSNEGLLSGIVAGSTVVYAEFEGVLSSPAIITVTDAGLSRLAISPPSLSLGVGDTVQLTAEATFSDGSSSDASSQVRWITNDGDIVTFEDSGLLIGESTGTTSVQVQWEGVSSDPIPVEVVAETPDTDIDLFVDAIASSVTDGRFEVTVGIRNSGSSAATNFWVDLFMDPGFTPTYGDWPDWYHFVEYVGPEESVFVNISAGTFAESHEYAVLLDSMQEVPETNEDNNVFTGSTEDDGFTGGGDGDAQPNLSITYVGSYADGGQTEYWVDVTNVGDADSDGFYIDIFHDAEWTDEPEVYSTGTVYEFHSGLPAGETIYATLIVDDECGSCGAWALIDSFDLVSESDESDNTRYIEPPSVWTLPAAAE